MQEIGGFVQDKRIDEKMERKHCVVHSIFIRFKIVPRPDEGNYETESLKKDNERIRIMQCYE
jgi:hypothetical protein